LGIFNSEPNFVISKKIATMKKLLFLFLFFVLFSCLGSDIEQIEHPEFGEQDFAVDASGLVYPGLEGPSYQYCGPGWGAKFCRFLNKYDGTIWADAENYYSDFSDIKFEKFSSGSHFISFFNLNNIVSYCQGWKLGENTYDGIKWNIEIKRDEVDILWFEYDYYGSGEEIEYSIYYKYEVIDGLLHFSSSEGEGQTFIFHPSEKNYSEDFLDTDEIIRLEGCLFQ